MKKLTLTLVWLCLSVWLGAQAPNLVPNGSLEEDACVDGLIPSINTTSTWYAINSDAYWLHDDCDYDPQFSAAIYSINPIIDPYDGKGYMSLEFVVTTSGQFLSEGIGIELKEKLKAGKNYYFEMATLQLGFEKAQGAPQFACNIPTDPVDMEVYFAGERVGIGFNDTIVDGIPIPNERFSNAVKVLTDTSFRNPEYERWDWAFYWDCFQAQGFETNIAIANQNKDVEDRSNCMEDFEFGVLYLNGFGIDAVQLVELPDRVDGNASICENGGWVDIREFVDNPFFDKATYLWEDGCTDTRRVIREPGVYNITMRLKELVIPITITVDIGSPCQIVFFNDEFPESVDTSLFYCPDDPVQIIQLDSLIPRSMLGMIAYEWEDGNTSSTRPITSADDLKVKAKLECFDFPINIEVTERDCQTNIYIPSAFSPNNDGINDEFGPFINSAWSFSKYSLKVFDRWGKLVFQSQDPTEFWDGHSKGRLSNHGTYIWLLEYELQDDRNTVGKESGQLLLIR